MPKTTEHCIARVNRLNGFSAQWLLRLNILASCPSFCVQRSSISWDINEFGTGISVPPPALSLSRALVSTFSLCTQQHCFNFQVIKSSWKAVCLEESTNLNMKHFSYMESYSGIQFNVLTLTLKISEIEQCGSKWF
jgi:hypothetical protein